MLLLMFKSKFSRVLWCCWFSDRKGSWLVKNFNTYYSNSFQMITFGTLCNLSSGKLNRNWTFKANCLVMLVLESPLYVNPSITPSICNLDASTNHVVRHCLSNALHSSIGQNMKSHAVSDIRPECEKLQMAITQQRVIRSTSCFILGWAFRGRQIEWLHFWLDQIQDGSQWPFWKKLQMAISQ